MPEAPKPVLQKLPPTVNWHLEPRCNYGCKFCFSTFSDIPTDEVLSEKELLMAVPALLKVAGASKLTFVGGEPFLHPLIDELIMEAKRVGLITSVVTNGSCLTPERLLKLRGHLDVLAFSIDASDDAIHAKLGRGMRHEVSGMPGMPRHGSAAASPAASSPPGNGHADGAPAAAVPCQHLARILELWPYTQELGYYLKINTVVTSENLHDEGLAMVVGSLQPKRWKAFQVLPVPNQNSSGAMSKLEITDSQFAGWVERNAAAAKHHGVTFVSESNEQMRGTYAMMDAACRFFSNVEAQGHEYGPKLFEDCGWAERLRCRMPSAPTPSDSGSVCGKRTPHGVDPLVRAAAGLIAGSGTTGSGDDAALRKALEAGSEAVLEAWSVHAGKCFNEQGFADRGGVYDWGQSPQELQRQMHEWPSGAVQAPVHVSASA